MRNREMSRANDVWRLSFQCNNDITESAASCWVGSVAVGLICDRRVAAAAVADARYLQGCTHYTMQVFRSICEWKRQDGLPVYCTAASTARELFRCLERY